MVRQICLRHIMSWKSATCFTIQQPERVENGGDSVTEVFMVLKAESQMNVDGHKWGEHVTHGQGFWGGEKVHFLTGLLSRSLLQSYLLGILTGDKFFQGQNNSNAHSTCYIYGFSLFCIRNAPPPQLSVRNWPDSKSEYPCGLIFM